MRAFLACFALGALGLATGCGNVDLNPPPSPDNPLDTDEKALIAALDDLRAQNGVTAKLLVCPPLNTSASAHSDDQRDNDYLSDTAADGSKPRDRACKAGYAPGCGDNLAMAELVALGVLSGPETLKQWEKDAKTQTLMLDGTFIVAGVGRAIQGASPIWTLDLASKDDASCH